MFNEILNIIESSSGKNFDDVSSLLEISVNNSRNFLEILKQIEIIPKTIFKGF